MPTLPPNCRECPLFGLQPRQPRTLQTRQNLRLLIASMTHLRLAPTKGQEAKVPTGWVSPSAGTGRTWYVEARWQARTEGNQPCFCEGV